MVVEDVLNEDGDTNIDIEGEDKNDRNQGEEDVVEIDSDIDSEGVGDVEFALKRGLCLPFRLY